MTKRHNDKKTKRQKERKTGQIDIKTQKTKWQEQKKEK